MIRRLAEAFRAIDVKHWLRHGAVVVGLLVVGGFLVAASGIVPIKASAGHWPITRWLLTFGMQRSVSTHALPVSTPPLDEPWLVLKGAGHYDFGCRPCHGRPGRRPATIALSMTPAPPYLPPVIPGWDDEELYYIVKHGVKFTAMPAWPALQRDDEVWAMVAFLRALPGLDAAGYERLVRGEDDAGGAALASPVRARRVPETVAGSCGPCHGVDGRGRGTAAFPRLAGQRPAYLLASLEAYARGHRHSGIMGPIAAALDAGRMRELADHYAALDGGEPPAPSPAGPAATVAMGEVIARDGIPGRRVPACAACHGPGAGPRNPVYPELAGQYADYLALQLELFAKDARGGTEYAHIMRMVAGRLTREQIRAVAAYYASLSPEGRAAESPSTGR